MNNAKTRGIGDTDVPRLQLALDYISLPSALAMAVKAGPYVDIVEIGTPLCKAAGMEAVRSVREMLPDKLVLADVKAPDCGGLEAQMSFDNGADLMTVLGGAPIATVKAALEVSDGTENKEMLMELTGVDNIIERAQEWKDLGVERMVYHRGWDEQAYDRQWDETDLETIQKLIDMGFKVSVTGGITAEFLPFFKDLNVSVIIAGREIHQADDPVTAAKQMKMKINELWG